MDRTNQLKEHFSVIKKHIVAGDFEMAFDMIEKILPDTSSLNEEVNAIIGRYNRIKKENRLGTINVKEKLDLFAPISDNLLEIISIIEKKTVYNKQEGSIQDPIQEIIKKDILSTESNKKSFSKILLLKAYSFGKAFLNYIAINLRYLYYTVEKVVLAFITFFISFFLTEKIYHLFGNYNVGFNLRFIVAFIFVSFISFYLLLILINWFKYSTKRIFNTLTEYSIVVILATIFFWQGTWIVSPIPVQNVVVNDSTFVSTLTYYISSEEIKHITLIEKEVIGTSNVGLVCSGIAAFESYQHDRALNSIFLLLENRKNLLSDRNYYNSMVSAFVSYKDKPTKRLKEILYIHKDSLTITPKSYILPLLDSTILPINKDLGRLKEALNNPSLTESGRVEILNKINVIELALKITSEEIRSVVAENSDGKNLILQLVLDVFLKNSFIITDESIYNNYKSMALNENLDTDTRIKFIRLIAMYKKPNDASYFADILATAKDDNVKIEAIKCLGNLQEHLRIINKNR